MHSFDPRDLFPPTQSTSRLDTLLPACSIALTGPLPTSSIFNLALAHLRYESDPQSPTSEKARGKRRRDDDESDENEEGDEDPPLASLQEQKRRVLILTPDQDVLRDELVKEGDVSLLGSRRSGETARLLDLIDIRYLPTSAHFTYFLTTLYTFSSPSCSASYDADLSSTKPPPAHPPRHPKPDPSYLPHEPTFVILHAVSDYLEEETNEGAGIEAYASLLALFLSTFCLLTSPPPLLILYDPLSASLSLPILPSHLTKSKSNKRPSRPPGKPTNTGEEFGGEEGGADGEGEKEEDRMALRKVTERFFDWVGEAHEVATEPTQSSFVLALDASPALHPFLQRSRQPERVEVEYVVRKVGAGGGGQQEGEEEEEGGVRMELVQ